MLRPEELATFREVAREVLARHAPRSEQQLDTKELFALAVDQGWLDLATHRAIDALVALTEELGRAAVPLPVADAYVATELLAPLPEVMAAIADGDVRLVVLPRDDEPRFVDAGDALTHVLLLDGQAERATLRPVIDARAHDGLVDPPWFALRLGEPAATVDAPVAQIEHAHTVLRLGLAARALGAARRTHELALGHARLRHQFGRPIGSFQAVQHREVDTETRIRCAAGLLEDATIRLDGAGRSGADALTDAESSLAVELFVTFAATELPRAQFDAHHTLGAVGYFDEHEAPWRFRRLHADLSRLRRHPVRSTADRLIEGGQGLPPLRAGDDAFRREVRELIARALPQGSPADPTDDDRRQFTAALADAGLLRAEWPREHGGRDASVADQLVLRQELVYAGAPIGNALGADALVAGAVLRHGTDAQRAAWLPRFARDELRACLGYSEPEAGSDLASLRTRAVRDGDRWLINGQKTWTTNAHVADAIWLATRTSDPDRPHDGITMFLVPMDTPGITVQQHRALSGGISCSVFLDDVEVTDDLRVGDVDGGWRIIVGALAAERAVMGARVMDVLRLFDGLVARLRDDPSGLAGLSGSEARGRLAHLAARIQAARTLVVAAVTATEAGRGDALEAPMAKVVTSELAEDFGVFALDVLGPAAALDAGDPDALDDGRYQYGLRLSLMYVIGGGTNDIQRNLLARSLGLPR